ncbi:MAG: hypothetical protein R3E97_11220 [Candidatus Eisenbacteria bacterium]
MALVLYDLLAAGEPQDVAWLLAQQGVPVDPVALSSAMPGLPAFFGRILSRATSHAISRSESARVRSVLDNGRSLGLIRLHPGIPERFSIPDGSEDDARNLTETILARWEEDQRSITDREGESLLRHLLAAPDRSRRLDDLRTEFFAEWDTLATAGASLAELQRRYECVREDRLRLLIEFVQSRGWIESGGGTVALTLEGEDAARALPIDWR